MKIIHISDLHLGKNLNGINLFEDQKYILSKIIEIIKKEKIDALLISGDIYDKSIPSAEAVFLLDEFLGEIKKLNIATFIISGNHDNQRRLSYGNAIFKNNNIFISNVYAGEVEKITLEDEFGKVNFYLLPFLKPSMVSPFFEGRNIASYDDAITLALEDTLAKLKNDERNIILAHQFVTGGSLSDSEDVVVGGVDNISKDHFHKFDYAALGHLHTPQKLGENIYYSGTPLKYSVSEANHQKGLMLITLKEKGNLEIAKIPLKPKRDLRKIKGKYAEIVLKKNYENTDTQDLVAITLTDEEEIPDIIYRLRAIYLNILSIDYENKSSEMEKIELAKIKVKSPLELFGEFYKLHNDRDLTDMQIKIIEEILDEEEDK